MNVISFVIFPKVPQTLQGFFQCILFLLIRLHNFSYSLILCSVNSILLFSLSPEFELLNYSISNFSFG